MDDQPNMTVREFIFVSESAIIGGIETLMVRMANSMNDRGYTVTVYSPSGPIVSELGRGVNWTEVEGGTPWKEALACHRPQTGTERVSVWLSHPYMLSHAYSLQKRLWSDWRITSNCISGVFIPAQFFRTDLRGRAKDAIIMKLPPLGSIYFMSEAVKESFVSIFGVGYRNWPVKRLAAGNKIMKAACEWRETEGLSIVSVGRLTPFKAYNFGASDIVKELRSGGIDCTWHIWGEGEDLERARQYAKAVGVHDHVLFHGTLPYSQLIPEVCKHDVFVGMGTAALEAAAVGVPTVIAIASSKNDCAGYLNEAPSDSIGEEVANLERKKIVSVLREYSSMSASEKRLVGEKCRGAVKDRMRYNESKLDEDLGSGFQYPARFRDDVRMGFYSFSIDMWRIFAKVVRRDRIAR